MRLPDQGAHPDGPADIGAPPADSVAADGGPATDGAPADALDAIADTTSQPDTTPPPSTWVVSPVEVNVSTTSSAKGRGLAVDGAGNTYIAGELKGHVQFGATTLNSGSTSAFVAKLDPAGAFVWAATVPGTYPDDIAVDASGNSHVATNDSVSKLDSSGKIVWTTPTGFHCNGIALDAAGNSYVAGWDHAGASASVPQNLRVAKLSAAGAVVWNTTGASSSYGRGRDIALDAAGNSNVVGTSHGSLSIGTQMLDSGGRDDLFIIKLANDGKVLWAFSAGGTSVAHKAIGRSIAVDSAGGGVSQDEAQGIALDGSGGIHITGSLFQTLTFSGATLTAENPGSPDVFVARFPSF